MSKAAPANIPDARHTAWQTVNACLLHNIPAQEALNTALVQNPLETRDRALVSELVYGYLRFKGRLDFLVRHHLRAPENIPAPALHLMSMAAYETCFLRIPAYATLNSTVEIMKQHVSPGLAKVANAVLRRIAELGDSVHEHDLYASLSSSRKQLDAAWYSLPPWLCDILRKHCGVTEPQQYLALLDQPPVGVRVNPMHDQAHALIDQFSSQPGLLAQDGPMFCFAPGSSPHDQHMVEQGAISLQGYGSYSSLMAMQPQDWAYPFWEGCCGRGGKSCALLESGMEPFWASDANWRRIAGFKSEIERLRIPAPFLFLASAADPLPLSQRPATIFLDVPCSGLGVLTRRPDIKWKLRKAHLRDFVSLQQRMLDNAVAQLPPGGKLVYVTCTLNRQENEHQVERLEQEGCVRVLEMSRTPWDAPWKEWLFHAEMQKPG